MRKPGTKKVFATIRKEDAGNVGKAKEQILYGTSYLIVDLFNRGHKKKKTERLMSKEKY